MVESGSVSFGQVRVDVGAREVTLAGELRHLEPQAFDLLTALIARRDRVVSKEELLDEVWGDQFVSESALTTRIKEVRRAVGDDGTRQEVVRNVRGRGYRFVAELDEPAPDAGHAAVPKPAHSETPSTPGGERPAGAPRGRDPGRALRGRRAELQVVLDHLEDAPLVTLVGPGGIGKTTLARAAAWSAGQTRSDGSVFVRLASIADGDDVIAAIRRAARIRDSALDDDEALAAVADRDVVIVLDNCEHVIRDVARAVGELLDPGGPCTVLATSRERLGLSSEVVVQLDVLAPEAAVALLEERARAVRPDFRVADHDPAAVDRLLDAVDRLPLGIEMAAGRLGSVPFDDLVELLADRTDVLRSTDRSADRHRTLGSLVQWSTDLLDDTSRAVLGDISVFASTVTTQDIEAVVTGESVMSVIADLVDRSLVTMDVDGRRGTYRMLSTIRAHTDRLRRPGVEARHAAWFTETAERAAAGLDTADERGAHERLDGCAAELRAAHRWARANDLRLAARLSAALDVYGHTRLWSEPARWSASLAEQLDDDGDDDPALTGVWAAMAADACHQGDFALARRLAGQVVAAGGVGLASAMESLQDCALYEGRLDESRAWSRRLVELGQEEDHAYAFITGVLGESLVLTYGGDPAAAADRVAPALGTAVAPTHRAWLEYALGEAAAEADPPAALRHFERARTLARSVSNHFVAGLASVASSSVIGRTGDPLDALTEFRPVLEDFHRSGNRTHAMTALRNLVTTLTRAGEDELAMTVLGGVDIDEARPSYGDERDRLRDARADVEGRAGAAAVAAWNADGAALGQSEVMRLVLRRLAALTAAR